MLRITPKQARTVHRLARDQCCNCTDGNCLLLDDGDSHPRIQMISLCVMVSDQNEHLPQKECAKES